MSNERPSKPVQRFSRYSRATFEDVVPSPPEDEPSLTDITRRALNAEPIVERPSAFDKPIAPLPPIDGNHDQPPPPEVLDWDEEQLQAPGRHALPTSPSQTTMHAEIGNWDYQPERDDFDEGETEPQLNSHSIINEAEAQIYPEQHVKAEKQPRVKRRKRRTGMTDAKAKGREKARQGINVLKSSAQAIRDRGWPLLMKSGLWIAHNLRRREIRRRFSRLLVLGHTHLTDRRTKQLFFIPSRKGERYDPAPNRGIHYDGPVPVKAFEWIMSFMPEDLREYAFIDIRAGRGRAALLAAAYNFKRIVAYEYEPQVFDDLQMNIAQYPRSQMICRNIDARRGDIDGIVMPYWPCIVYISNAWREPMIDGIIQYVADTYRQSPRRIYVILENTAADTALDKSNIFELLEPPMAERLKLRLLSPVDFKVYRSIT